jgi:hypothetical protein
LTAKVFDAPVSLPPLRVAVIVDETPDWLRMIVWLLNSPAMNAGVAPAPDPIVWVELMSTVPPKLVSLLPAASFAVI